MRPLQRATHIREPGEELIAAWMDAFQCNREEALKRINDDFAQTEVWLNDVYQVEARRYPTENGDGPDVVQLNIRRRDGNVIFRDWRHFQEIKNQVVGPECEAIEIYPAESRLVDTSNKYHLWAVSDPSFRFPFGWRERDVRDDGSKVKGLRQRPFAKSKNRSTP